MHTFSFDLAMPSCTRTYTCKIRGFYEKFLNALNFEDLIAILQYFGHKGLFCAPDLTDMSLRLGGRGISGAWRTFMVEVGNGLL